MKNINSLILVVLIFCFSLNTTAQEDRRSSIDVNAGMSLPHTDVPGTPNFLGSVAYKYSPSHPVSLRAALTGGSLSGSDNGQNYDRHFTNNFFAATLGADVNLFALMSLDQASQIIDPYLSAEIGPMFSNISTLNDQEGYGTIYYNGVDLAIGAGGGFRFYLTPAVDINTRYTFYIPNSDNIDGHNPNVAGNDANDFFSGFTVGVNIKFGEPDAAHAMWATRDDPVKEEEIAELRKKEKEKTKEVMEQEGQEEESSSPANKTDPASEEEQAEESPTPATSPNNNQERSAEKNEQEEETAKEQTNEPARERSSNEQKEMTTEQPAQNQAAREEKDEDNGGRIDRENRPESKEVVTDKENPEKEYNIYTSKVLHSDGTIGEYKYYIIVGSYTTLENAKAFIAQQNNRHSLKVITDYFEQHYRVAIDKTNSVNEALNMLKDYQQNYDPESWVLENVSY